MLRLPAPAKINLGLEIIDRREDGFHDLETVFQTLELADTITFRPWDGPACILRCSDPDLPRNTNNLALRAAESYRQLNQGPAWEIILDKHIPAGGGLGGGSSDAATVLRGMQVLSCKPLDTNLLVDLAQELGSDVPFFLHGGSAWATGRGEVLEELDDLVLPEVTLVIPPFGCSTPACFAALDEDDRGPRTRRKYSDWNALWTDDVQASIANRLLGPALRHRPALAVICSWAKTTGLPWSLSGSGSTIYCLGHATTPPPEGCRVLFTAARPRLGLDRLA